MTKLTHDDMFRLIDQFSTFCEENLGRSYSFKREPDGFSVHFSKRPSNIMDGQKYLPGFMVEALMSEITRPSAQQAGWRV